MRMMIFIPSLGAGGAERVAVNLADHWASQGRDVTLVTIDSRASDFYVPQAAVKRVALDLARPSGNMVVASLRNLQRVLALRRILRELQPDVCLALLTSANILLALAARGMPGLLSIGAEHTYPPRMPLGRVWEGLRRRVYGRLSAVVMLTQEGSDWMRRHSRARHVAVIPNAAFWPLPEQAPLIAPESVIGPGRVMLLAAGRLSEEKNFDQLISTFARLAERHPRWDLVILGEGPLRASLERTVVRHGCQGRVFLPGRAGNVGHWYARADLFALCSRYEGFPNALVEAMSYGVPCVSVDCDTGPRDIIRHEVDGVLIPPGDAAAFEKGLSSLMQDDARRAAFARQATTARDRFSAERIARMWDQLFAHCAVAGESGATFAEAGDA